MNESEFDKKATDTLLRIEQGIEESGADIDFEAAGGILTLEFANGRGGQVVNKDGSWRAGHDRIGTELQVVPHSIDEASQVACRDHADQSTAHGDRCDAATMCQCHHDTLH